MLTFAPDLDPRTPNLIVGGTGFRPHTKDQYGSHLSMLEQQNASASGWGALTEAPNVLWGAQLTGATNTARLYAGVASGSTSKIYELRISNSDGSYTAPLNVSVGGTSFTLSTPPVNPEDYSNVWAMTSYGTIVLAGNKGTTAATLHTQSASGSNFAALSGSPNAATLETFKDFILAGNVSDYGAVTGTFDMVAWCALGDYTSWTPSAATQAGNQRLTDSYGPITCIKRLADSAVIYKGRAMYLATYVDNVTLFSFQRISDRIGCRVWAGYPPAIVDIGNAHIFVGATDVYLFDGTRPVPITQGIIETLGGLSRDASGMGGINGYALPPTRMTHDALLGEVYFWQWGYLYNYRYGKWGTISTSETSSAVAVFSGNASGMLKLAADYSGVSAGTLIAKSDKKIYNRYTDNSSNTSGYESMVMVFGLWGDNKQRSVLTRVIPTFTAVPISGTLTYKQANALGLTPSTIGSSVSMEAARCRFDMMSNAPAGKWHQVSILFVGYCQIADCEKVTVAGGAE